ncbi:MAG TPA: glycosyltransferase family 4 protein [Tepidisphaeraceae bacterium]|nr:glycosyltransferase family 4 protein [Tepidisphaeraceae bacterium]
MRIALVILHGDPARGGAERYTVDLAAALRGRGHDVALVASTFAPGELPAGGVRLGADGGTRVGRYLSFLDQLDKHLIEARYDIVHAMLPVRSCDVYHPHAGIAAEAVRGAHLKEEGPVMRMIAQVSNGMNRRRQRFAAVERALLRGGRVPVVLCLSEYVKRDVAAHYALDPSRLATLFNATDLHRFDPAARPGAGDDVRRRFNIAPGKVVALMIAQDFHRKGLAEAIAAAGQVKDERLVLLVVGKQDPAPYKRMAQRAGAADGVIFAGKTDDPYAFYKAADFFVLPTRHDPCSLVVLEALAMGVAVVSTAFNGACEIMTDGLHGFVLPDPADVPALAEAMRRLLDDAARRIMSAQCLALRPRLAYEHHLDELLAIYSRARLDEEHKDH